MKKLFLLTMVAVMAFPPLYAQSKIDTVDFKTGVTRIIQDYPNHFQNLKASDTCKIYCLMNQFIPGSFYTLCSVDKAFFSEVNNTCSILFGYYNYDKKDAEKYKGYTDTDSAALQKIRAGMKTDLYDAATKIFGKVTADESKCDLSPSENECYDYRIYTENLNKEQEHFEIHMKMKRNIKEDGGTYWGTIISFSMEQW